MTEINSLKLVVSRLEQTKILSQTINRPINIFEAEKAGLFQTIKGCRSNQFHNENMVLPPQFITLFYGVQVATGAIKSMHV